MRRQLASLVAMALVGASGAALAQVPDPDTTTIYSAHPWDMGSTEVHRGIGQYRGRAALPGKGRLLIVQPKATSQVYLVGRTHYVDERGNALPAGALRDGDEVRVDFDIIGNTAVARKVTIVQPPEPLP